MHDEAVNGVGGGAFSDSDSDGEGEHEECEEDEVEDQEEGRRRDICHASTEGSNDSWSGGNNAEILAQQWRAGNGDCDVVSTARRKQRLYAFLLFFQREARLPVSNRATGAIGGTWRLRYDKFSGMHLRKAKERP